MIYLLIIVIVIIIVVNKNKNSGSNKNNQVNNSRKASMINVSFGNESPRTYSSVLNCIEQDIHYIAKHTYGYGEINVVVTVQKNNDTYCTVSGSYLADLNFSGVNFGVGYNYNGNDKASFKTKLATGFTNLEDVKREMLIQFNWSDLPTYNTKFTTINHGDYVSRPYISYSFTVKGW